VGKGLRMERISSKTVYEGQIASVRIDEFRYPDGEVAEREIVVHPGAVAIVAHDDLHVYLVRQPREAVEEEELLELPAGKLDVEGESALECAQRELGEEIGKSAGRWTELKRFYTTPGFAQEEVTLFLATGLQQLDDHQPSPEERIEIAPWPLGELERAIDACSDAKSLIGLLLLQRLRSEPGA
jgi:8-oxo-dGTP pyrophosphatase MutT (NUDIX family)